MPTSPKDALELLDGKRIEIADLSEISKGSRSTAALDQQSIERRPPMGALQAQATAKEAQRRREHELERIDDAFRRLEEGSFGYCIECGAEISLSRLEIDPAVTHCVTCAQKLEKKKKN